MRYVGEWFPNALSVVFRILVLASLTALASCVQPTVFPRYLTVADVINNVKCELHKAIYYSPNSKWLGGWKASFNVSLQVFRRGSGSAELTVVVPYGAPGTFKTGFFGSLEKSGKNIIALDFNAGKNLDEFMSKSNCTYAQELKGRRNLAGNTGLSLWFGNAIEGVSRANIVEQSTGLTYTLEFITTVDGNIKPAFSRIFSPVRMFNGTFDLGRRRQDTNTLVVAFSPVKPAAPAFAETDLGKVLLSIEASLKSNEKLEDDASVKVSQAQDKLEMAIANEAKIRAENAPKKTALLASLKDEQEASAQAFKEGATEEAQAVNKRIENIKLDLKDLTSQEQAAADTVEKKKAKKMDALRDMENARKAAARDREARAALLTRGRQVAAPSVSADTRNEQLITRSYIQLFQNR